MIDYENPTDSHHYKQLYCYIVANLYENVGNAGAQFEGDLGEILALGAEISPYIGLSEKWESP